MRIVCAGATRHQPKSSAPLHRRHQYQRRAQAGERGAPASAIRGQGNARRRARMVAMIIMTGCPPGASRSPRRFRARRLRIPTVQRNHIGLQRLGRHLLLTARASYATRRAQRGIRVRASATMRSRHASSSAAHLNARTRVKHPKRSRRASDPHRASPCLASRPSNQLALEVTELSRTRRTASRVDHDA